MAVPAAVQQARGVHHVLLLWQQPRSMSGEEADIWTTDEARRLLSAPSIEWVHVVALEGVGSSPASYAWMLELHPRASAVPEDVVREQAFAELVGDLRMLGLRPLVVRPTVVRALVGPR
jgi:hypothetical protein